MNLKADPDRMNLTATGVLVRAQFEGVWTSVDVMHLDRESLMAWLRSRGGENPWAEKFVALVLGHDVDADSVRG